MNEEKLELTKNFVEHCKEWGRIEKAIELLQKLKDEEEIFIEHCEEYDQMIKEIINTRSDLYESCAKRYNVTERLPVTDETLDNVIREIEISLESYSSEPEEVQTGSSLGSSRKREVEVEIVEE